MSLLRRQIINSVLTLNALRPPRNQAAGSLAFFPGWVTSELAPHLMALTALDAVLHLKGRKHRNAGLALAAVNLAGQALLLQRGRSSRGHTEAALLRGLGDDYSNYLDRLPTEADLATPWRSLVQPFVFSTPTVSVARDIAYGDAPKKRNLLDVYRRADVQAGDTPAPVLLQVHGGGWVTGEKDQQGRALMNRMAERGWVCVAINYRLSPHDTWPAHIVDVKKAIAWIKEHIAEYGGDPDYIVVTGGSAGGHLSALAALTPNDPDFQPGFEDADTSVQGAVPLYGVYDIAGVTDLASSPGLLDFMARRIFKKDAVNDHALFVAASPIARVTEQAPDFFVLHGNGDSTADINQSRALVATLKEKGHANVSWFEVPYAQHMFDTFHSVRADAVTQTVGRWLVDRHTAHQSLNRP